MCVRAYVLALEAEEVAKQNVMQSLMIITATTYVLMSMHNQRLHIPLPSLHNNGHTHTHTHNVFNSTSAERTLIKYSVRAGSIYEHCCATERVNDDTTTGRLFDNI